MLLGNDFRFIEIFYTWIFNRLRYEKSTKIKLFLFLEISKTEITLIVRLKFKSGKMTHFLLPQRVFIKL